MSFQQLVKTSTFAVTPVSETFARVVFNSDNRVIAMVHVFLNTRTTTVQLLIECDVNALSNKCIDYLNTRALQACFPNAGYDSQKALDAVNQAENPEVFSLIHDI